MPTQIKDYKARLSDIRDLLATQQIEASDYWEMKSNYIQVINKLGSKLSAMVLDENKKGTKKKKSSLSFQVTLSGLFPNHFVNDLKLLANTTVTY